MDFVLRTLFLGRFSTGSGGGWFGALYPEAVEGKLAAEAVESRRSASSSG
jgi:hypothetical protein